MTTTKIVGMALAGLLLGTSCVVLAVIACVGAAYLTYGVVELPGIFKGWITEENGFPALNFIPNGIGMLTAIVAIGAAFTVVGVLRARRQRSG